MRKLLMILFMILLIPNVYSEIVLKQNIEIISDDIFYCQNVFRGDECLISGEIQINNDNLIQINPIIKTDFTTDISFNSLKLNDRELSINKKSKEVVTKDKEIIQKSNIIKFSFFSSQSGKFNLTLELYNNEIFLDTLILDPYYNVTINATSPSWHLQNGNNNTIPDDNYTNKTDISLGLIDKSDDTTYITSSGISGGSYVQYHLNEEAGTFISDSSGNNRNGNAVNIEDDDWINGKLNNALKLNGINKYINCGDIANFERDESFSFEIWFNTTTTSVDVLMDRYGSSRGWSVYFDSGKIVIVLTHDSTNFIKKQTVNTYNDNNYHHLIITYDGSSTAGGVIIYVDGEVVSISTIKDALTDTILSAPNCSIGSRQTALYYEGIIDEAVIYNRELTQLDVIYRYNSGNGAEETNVNAIKPYFNYPINGNYNYWLKLRKTSLGVDTIRVHTYLNETHINKTNYLDYSFHTGYDFIPITSIVYSGYNLGYRFFPTISQEYFSEAQLVEEIEDNESPRFYDCKIDFHNDLIHTPTSLQTIVGIVDSGNVTSLQFKDDNYLNISEVSETPAIEIYFNFSDIKLLPYNLNLYGYYDGLPAHNVYLQLFNHSTGGWTTIFEITDLNWYNYTFPSCDCMLNFIGVDNLVHGRIIHPVQGNAADDLYIDYIELLSIKDHATCNIDVTYSCLVNDTGIGVDKVFFKINSSSYSDTEVDKIIDTDFYYKNETYSVLETLTKVYEFINVNSTDPLNNGNSTDLNIRFNYSCITACSPNWVTLYDIGDCDIDDTYYNITYYNDTNECEVTPPSNDTDYIYCNYCSENINQYTEDLEECNDVTLLKNVSYYYLDDDYNICCGVTNISSDCNILNETLYQNYTQLDNCGSIDCLYDETPYLRTINKKISWICNVNKNISYDFVTYVKTFDNELLQINPDRELIKEYGEYNTFKSQNGLVNLYFITKNLRPDRTVIFIVEGEQGKFNFEKNITPTYRDYYELQDRLFWGINNSSLLIGGFFLIVVLGILCFIVIKVVRKEWRLL